MEFFTGAVVGGLIYDALKVGTLESIAYVRLALNDMLLTDEEKVLIAQDLSNATAKDKGSKDTLIAYFEEQAPNTQKIVNKYQQTNITRSGSGDIVMGDKKTKVKGDYIGRDKIEVAGDLYQGGKHKHHHYDTSRNKRADSKEEKTIRIFLASSSELREDRDAFDLYFRQQNDRLRKEGIYLEIIRWENFLDAMSETRLQDEYNEAIKKCDIFVSLFKTKTGKYTEEEFDVAHQTFLETGKPLIYTYFKKATVSTNGSNRNDLMSLWNFQDRLKELGHFQTEYESIEGLTSHFRDQLDKLRDDDRI